MALAEEEGVASYHSRVARLAFTEICMQGLKRAEGWERNPPHGEPFKLILFMFRHLRLA